MDKQQASDESPSSALVTSQAADPEPDESDFIEAAYNLHRELSAVIEGETWERAIMRTHLRRAFVAGMRRQHSLMSPSSAAADPVALQEEIARLKKALVESRKDSAYHSDCRPNRRQAEAAIADAKAMNDKWADERVRAEAAEVEVSRLSALLAERTAQEPQK